MPETSCVLCLHSPVGSDVAIYKWPLHITETWNEAHEIAETVRWACSDFPELGTAMENCIRSHFDPTSYESMKLFCEKYNRAVDNIRKLWSGRQPPPSIDAPPTRQHLKHILTQVYNRAVSRPEELNQYEPFSPEVYGETSFELIQEVINATRMNENDIFLDLGSGVGQVVLQVSAYVGCKAYGIEKAEIPTKYAEEMDRQFQKWMDFYGKSYGDYELFKGDFLDPQFDEIINSATIIFSNNFAFGPTLNHHLKLKFQNLRDGVKIVSSREFCSTNFRLTERNLSDIGAMMRVEELSPLKGSVSWTGKPVTYYLHKIDRTKLEEFFQQQKRLGEAKSEGSSRTVSPYSVRDTGSSSSESSSEDSSLDSSDDEDLFTRTKQEEMYHFPPSCTQHYSSQLDRPHLLSNVPRRKSITTSSAILKKATPPSGTTHMPRPHPQVLQPLQQKHRNKLTSRNRSRPQHQGPHSKPKKDRFLDATSMTSLFELFQKQMQAYINQLDSPHFNSWLTDAVEKEKMKQKHLHGIIEHLESEVGSLSVETINSMKQSMLSIGITNLTPEGLLSGAKDIVSLNRQLRKEVQLLEKEVNQLKEQHQIMNVINKQLPPNKEDHYISPATTTTAVLGGEHKMDSVSVLALPQIPPPNVERMATEVPEECTNVLEKPLPEKKDEHIDLTQLGDVSILIVDEAVKVSMDDPDFNSDVNLYQIRLETIDQAVLELGPFAKDINHQERLESIPLEWPPEVMMKRERRKSFSPARPTKPSRISTDEPSPLITSSPGRDIPPPPLNKSQRRGRKKTQKEGSADSSWNSTDIPVNQTGSSGSSNPLFLVQSGVSSSPKITPLNQAEYIQSLSQESSAAEAMLALSGGQPTTATATTEHYTERRPQSTLTEENESTLAPTVRPPTVLRNIPDETEMSNGMSNTSQTKLSGFPPSYSLPPLSKLPPDPNIFTRRRTSSSSSHRSSVHIPDDRASMFSPNSIPPQHVTPPPTYVQLDNKMGGVSVVRAPPTTSGGNPFWPVPSQPTDSNIQSQGFPYTIMAPPTGWNQPYRPSYYSPLTYPRTSVDTTLDLTNQALRPVLPYYFLRYPFPAPALAGGSPFTGPSLVTSSTVSSLPGFHTPTLSSSSTPSHLSSFKNFHHPFNRSLTPPTLHPLGTTQPVDNTKPPTIAGMGGADSNSWIPYINNQYQNTAFLTSQFAAIGAAQGSSIPLTLLANAAGLQVPAVDPGVIINRYPDKDHRNRNKKEVPVSSELSVPAVHPPTVDNESLTDHRSPSLQFEDKQKASLHSSHSAVMMVDGTIAKVPSYVVPTPPPSRQDKKGVTKNDKTTPEKVKLKIHQINNEDFKLQDKMAADRRKKRGRGRSGKEADSFNTHNPIVISPSSHDVIVDDALLPSDSTQEDGEESIDIISIDTAPTPLTSMHDTELKVDNTDTNEREADPIITVNEDSVSSEGTMSASPSPPATPTVSTSTNEPFTDTSTIPENLNPTTSISENLDATPTILSFTATPSPSDNPKATPTIPSFTVTSNSSENVDATPTNSENLNTTPIIPMDTENVSVHEKIEESSPKNSPEILKSTGPLVEESHDCIEPSTNDAPIITSHNEANLQGNYDDTVGEPCITSNSPLDIPSTTTIIQPSTTTADGVLSSPLNTDLLDSPPSPKKLKLDLEEDAEEEEGESINVQTPPTDKGLDISDVAMTITDCDTMEPSPQQSSSEDKVIENTLSSWNDLQEDINDVISSSLSPQTTTKDQLSPECITVSDRHTTDNIKIPLSGSEVNALISQDSQVTSSVDERTSKIPSERKPINRKFLHNSLNKPHKLEGRLGNKVAKHLATTVSSKHPRVVSDVKKSEKLTVPTLTTNRKSPGVECRHQPSHTHNDSKSRSDSRSRRDENRLSPLPSLRGRPPLREDKSPSPHSRQELKSHRYGHHKDSKRKHSSEERHRVSSSSGKKSSHHSPRPHYHDGWSHQRSHSSTPVRDVYDSGRSSDGGSTHHQSRLPDGSPRNHHDTSHHQYEKFENISDNDHDLFEWEATTLTEQSDIIRSKRSRVETDIEDFHKLKRPKHKHHRDRHHHSTSKHHMKE